MKTPAELINEGWDVKFYSQTNQLLSTWVPVICWEGEYEGEYYGNTDGFECAEDAINDFIETAEGVD